MTILSRALFVSLTTVGMAASANVAFADDTTPMVEGSATVETTSTTTVTPATPMVETQSMSTTTTMTEKTHTGSRIGVAVVLGVGGGGFTNETMRDTTEVGGDYTGRVTVGSRLPIAFEGSYIGSVQYLDTFGLNNNAVLVGNGAQGDLRINVLPHRMLTPFVFGGAAWRHYTLKNLNGVNMSNVSHDDDVLEIPMGAGLAMRAGGLAFDLRGEYRAAFREDLVESAPNDSGAHAPMNRWGATLNIGKEF